MFSKLDREIALGEAERIAEEGSIACDVEDSGLYTPLRELGWCSPLDDYKGGRFATHSNSPFGWLDSDQVLTALCMIAAIAEAA